MTSRSLITLLLLVMGLPLLAQDAPSKLDQAMNLPIKLFQKLDTKSSAFEQKLDKQTEKYLSRLQKQERKLREKLYKKDSALAKQLFNGVDEKYNQFKNKTAGVNKASLYSGHLDSVTTALHFLQNKNLTGNPSLQKSLAQYKALQSKFDATEQAKKFMKQRRELLKKEFEKLGMVKELKKFRKEVYYYQEQISSYKKMFENPNQVEAKLMEWATKTSAFREFFKNNSMLGSMFALPSTNSTASFSLIGLQTRAAVNQNLINQFGSVTTVRQVVSQNMQTALGELDQLKNKLSKLSSGSYGNTNDDEIPGFRPNNERVKSFFQRLEYSANVQSQRARYFFPVISDVALALGYKLDTRSTAGVGLATKIGWGTGWNNIRLSYEGLGLRTYFDWSVKEKGAFILSAGYEQNYRSLIHSIDQLKDQSAWQSSGLIGLGKKYSINKKMKGEMKLLWDFLSYRQVPRSQAFLFRVGYSIK